MTMIPLSKTREVVPASVVPHESKIYRAQLGDIILEFNEHRVRGDGNCGFTSLGTTREEVSSLLLSCASDEKSRIELADEIQGLLRETRESKLHTKETYPLFKELDTAQAEVDEQVRQLNNQLESKATLATPFQRQNLEGLIEKLKNSSDSAHQTALTALHTARLKTFQIEERIKIFCQSRDVFEHYITKGLALTEWLGYRSAKLFAKLKEYNLYVFHPAANKSGWLELAEQQVCAAPKNTFYLLHTDGFTHYNLLSVSVPAPAPLEKKLSRALIIDFESLKKSLVDIKHVKARAIVKTTLELFAKQVEEHNRDADNSLIATDALVKTLTSLQTLVDNRAEEITHNAPDKYDEPRIQSIFDCLKSACETKKQALSRHSLPIKLEAWQAQRLRFEQELLLSGSPLGDAFHCALHKIATLSRSNHILPNGIYICTAKLDEADQQLQWIMPFLERLRGHLYAAGFHKVKLNTKTLRVGEAKEAYLKDAEEDDFVLVIGTPLLLRQHQAGEPTLQAELNHVQRKKEKELGLKNQRVMPLLISGTVRTAFPAQYESYHLLNWQNTKTYFQHLYELIVILYSTQDSAFEKIWQEFLDPLEEGTRLILRDGLTEQSVLKRQEKEKIQQQKEEEKRDKAGSSLVDSKASVPTASSSIPTVNALTTALQTYYGAKGTLPGLLTTDHAQSIADINLSIIEHQTHAERPKKSTETKEDKRETKASEQEEVLAHYEALHNVSHPIPVADIFDITRKAPGSLDLKPPKRLLILGAAGVGKTTMSQYLAYQWAIGKLWNEKFDYVFWIPLRNLSRGTEESKKAPSLIRIIHHECFASDTAISIRAIENILTDKASRTLMLLDGYDEVAHLLETPDQPLAKILSQALDSEFLILTSRPHQLHNLPLSLFDRRLENTGFTDTNIENYVRCYFSTLTPPQPKRAKNMLTFIKANPSIWGTAHIPINLALICEILHNLLDAEADPELKEGKRETKTITDEAKAETLILNEQLTMTGLYQEITTFLLKRHLEKTGQSTRDRGTRWIVDHCALELEFLGLLAWTGLIKYQITLDKTLQHDALNLMEARYKDKSTRPPFHAILDSGFLKASGDSKLREEINKPHYFIHLTFQEYLAAHYLVEKLRDPKTDEYANTLEFLQTEKYNSRYQVLLGFMAGLLSAEKPSRTPSPTFLIFWNTLLDEPIDLTRVGHLRLMIRCLEEASCDSRIPHCKTLLEEVGQWLMSRHAGKWMIPAIQRASKVFKHTGVLERLLSCDNESSEVRERAVDVLGELGPVAATPEVIHALVSIIRDDEKRWGRGGAIKALGQLGPAAATPEAIRALITIILDKEHCYDLEPIKALGQLGPAAATPQVIYTLISIILDNEKRWSRSVDEAVDALGQLGPAAATPEVIRALLTLLSNKDNIVRSQQKDWGREPTDQEMLNFSVGRALSQLAQSTATAEVICALLTMLDDKEDVVRRGAAKILGQLGQSVATPEVIQALLTTLNDKDEWVRRNTADALGQLGPATATPKVISALLTALDDKNEGVKQNAAEALGNLGPAASIPKVISALITLLDDKQEEATRHCAANALSQLVQSTATPSLIHFLVSLLVDNNSGVWECAANALGRLHTAAVTPEVIRAARTALDDEKDPDRRSRAAKTLGLLGPAAATPEVILYLLSTLRDKNAYVRCCAAKALGRFGSAAATPEVIRALLTTLYDKESHVSNSAAEALSQFGPIAATPDTLHALITAMSDEEDQVRISATGALHKFGSATTPEVIRALITARNDEHYAVRGEAEHALVGVNLSPYLLFTNPVLLRWVFKFGFSITGRMSSLTPISELIKAWLVTQNHEWLNLIKSYALDGAIPITLTSTSIQVQEGKNIVSLPLPATNGPFLVASLIKAFAAHVRELSLPCQFYEALLSGSPLFPVTHAELAVSATSYSSPIAAHSSLYSLIKSSISIETSESSSCALIVCQPAVLILLQQADLSAARRYFGDRMLNFDNQQLHEDLMRHYAQKNEPFGCILHAQQALRIAKETNQSANVLANLYHWLGYAYYCYTYQERLAHCDTTAQTALKQVELHFQQSIKLFSYTGIHTAYGQFLLGQGRIDDALVQWQIVLTKVKAKPSSLSYTGMGRVILDPYLQGELDEWEELSLPAILLAHYLLVSTHIKQADLIAAQTTLIAFSQRVETLDTPLAYSLLGHAQQALGDSAAALKSYTRALVHKPAYGVAQQQKALCQQKLGLPVDVTMSTAIAIVSVETKREGKTEAKRRIDPDLSPIREEAASTDESAKVTAPISSAAFFAGTVASQFSASAVAATTILVPAKKKTGPRGRMGKCTIS